MTSEDMRWRQGQCLLPAYKFCCWGIGVEVFFEDGRMCIPHRVKCLSEVDLHQFRMEVELDGVAFAFVLHDFERPFLPHFVYVEHIPG